MFSTALNIREWMCVFPSFNVLKLTYLVVGSLTPFVWLGGHHTFYFDYAISMKVNVCVGNKNFIYFLGMVCI